MPSIFRSMFPDILMWATGPSLRLDRCCDLAAAARRVRQGGGVGNRDVPQVALDVDDCLWPRGGKGEFSLTLSLSACARVAVAGGVAGAWKMVSASTSFALRVSKSSSPVRLPPACSVAFRMRCA